MTVVVVLAVVRFDNPNAAHVEMRMVRVRALRRLGDDDVLPFIAEVVDNDVCIFGSGRR